MAVYTSFQLDELAPVVRSLSLGELRGAVGVPQGSINTNYKLTTTTGVYFLRHTTVRSAGDLRFEAALLAHLEEAAFPAPRLVRSADGEPFVALKAGLVSVFHYLPGEERTRAGLLPEHCERLGQELGKLHRVTGAFEPDRANPYGREVVRGWWEGLAAHPDASLAQLARELGAELDGLSLAGPLPRGVIHADLFLDNVKWVGDRISALFDFEMACRDVWILDLAITLNAWCFDQGYREELCRALVRGYREERSLLPGEAEALYGFALFGALRYTASRIRDFHLSPLPPERLVRKDYRTYLARVRELKALGPADFARRVGL